MKREKAIYLPLSTKEKKILQEASKEAAMSQREYLRSFLWTMEGVKKATKQ